MIDSMIKSVFAREAGAQMSIELPSGCCKTRLSWFGNSNLPAQLLFGDVINIPGIIWNSNYKNETFKQFIITVLF